MSSSKGNQCPVCGSGVQDLGYRIDGVPVRSMTLHADRTSAMEVERGAIELAGCGGCGLVFNAAFDPATQLDDSDYEETQGASGVFRGYSADLARRLIDRHGLEDGVVLDIGCGKAGFLATMCRQAPGLRALGIDPTVDPDRVPDDLRERLLVRRDRYRDGDADWAADADLVCCRHTLEHLIDPLEILAPLRRHLEHRRDTPLFIDVPAGGHVFDVGGCWDVYYEHCMYYRDEAFVRMLRRAGFHVRDSRREYDDQYLCIEAVVGDPKVGGAGVEPPDLGPLKRLRAAWSDWFATESAREVVLWGSGSRSVGFLGAVEDGGSVTGVVDINPVRRGRWMPGFEHAILAPEDLRLERPRSIVIMNPAYEGEIRSELDRLGVVAEVHRVDRPPGLRP